MEMPERCTSEIKKQVFERRYTSTAYEDILRWLMKYIFIGKVRYTGF